MTRTAHRIFISLLVAIVLFTLIIVLYRGISYYRISLEERFYSPDHNLLKPSGILGHGFGIIGSLLMIIGVVSYMFRKRFRFLSRLGILKHWLEFHIFLCTLGPILIFFHTALKFGGLVAISFWSMVAVFLSGIIGRFIYIQIPRSIEGRELSLNEVMDMKTDVAGIIRSSHNIDDECYNAIINLFKKKIVLYQSNAFVGMIRKYISDNKSIRSVRKMLKRNNLPKADYQKILSLVKSETKLNRKIDRLDIMQNLFKYWHVIHSPFALVMLIIMVIHVSVTIVFGYKWIF